MSVAALRDEVIQKARDVAWEQWTQLGLSGPPPRDRERRAADPEALLLFTFETGRHDPRLFDEVLDWLVLNEQLVSVQRLRNLATDDVSRALVDASLSWVAQWRPRARLSGRAPTAVQTEQPTPLFIGLSPIVASPDPAFLKHGFLRPRLEPSRKSQKPDLTVPISLAFRLRRLLGVGVRAEVLRALLTLDAPRVSAGVLYASAGFSRQNVREGLHQLQEAGVVLATGTSSDQSFVLQRADWARLLGVDPEQLPAHHDWIQALGALREIMRWLADTRLDESSEYMRASEARALLSRLEPDLRYAGVPVGGHAAKGAEYWDEFERTVRALLGSL